MPRGSGSPAGSRWKNLADKQVHPHGPARGRRHSHGLDPRAYDDPDQIEITRDTVTTGSDRGKATHHPSFGHGRHLCTGMRTAHIEAQVAFERLLKMTYKIALLIDGKVLTTNASKSAVRRGSR